MAELNFPEPPNFFPYVSHMEYLTDDGKIMKKITRKGRGITPPPTAITSILYTTFTETDKKPLDGTHSRRPLKLQLDNTKFVGLNYAVISMKTNESSLFYIHHDFPFGKMISNDEGTSVWVLIELLRYSDSKIYSVYDNIHKKNINLFPSAQEYTLALLENAKLLITKNVSVAIREYQKAYKMISRTKSRNDSELYEQNKLKIRILSNLVICFNKEKYSKKACLLCNDIYNLAKNPLIPLPAKYYFNYGKALFDYGDYDAALKKFEKAKKLEPKNLQIIGELSKVGCKLAQEREREKSLWKLFLKGLKENKQSTNNSDNPLLSNTTIDFI